MARPPKLGEKDMKEILALVGHGITINHVADYMQVDRSTMFRFLKKPEFRDRYKKAKVNGEIRSLAVLANSKVWTAHAWLLERRWPEKYIKRTQVEHVGRALPGDTYTDNLTGEIGKSLKNGETQDSKQDD